MEGANSEIKKRDELLSLEKIWEESKGEVDSNSFRELVRVNMRIEASEKKRKMLFRVFSFVAAAAVIAIVAIFSFSLARNKYNISAMDYTKSLVADYGHISSLTLSDGTEVHLNAGSTLLYPEQFDKSKRIVYLTGEGNFQVAKDPSRPFIVKTAYMDVQALGTTFCIESYLGESAIRTTLKEGRVKVDIPSVNSGSYFLDPDSQLIFRPSEKKVSLARVDARKVLSWEDGYLSFSNASFPQIISSLERKYNVSISYNAEKMRVGNTLNVRFAPEDSLEDALKVLTLLIPGSSFRNIDDRYYYNF